MKALVTDHRGTSLDHDLPMCVPPPLVLVLTNGMVVSGRLFRNQVTLSRAIDRRDAVWRACLRWIWRGP